MEEQKIITQVAHRAKLAAQREFPDEDILDPEWNPDQLARAIEALRTMDIDAFTEEFETYYRYVTDTESAADVPIDRVEGVYQPFLVTDDNEIDYVPTPVVQYQDSSGETTMTHRESRFEALVDEPQYTKFTATLPPLEFDDGAYEFPEGFQIFLIEHFAAKIRDVYRHVGERPPEPYDEVDVVGKFLTAADDEYYRDFIAMIE
ncbi:hypothetical protein [Halococcoides cellulosivorans]|uniref:Uncharacterized protein n=1 Tax=Halococcoides cellulosivorans TaxID=1679096 RepID=A0A2R4WYV2_9EURY|nr:hypothetical protein [Halococcoides cellulosivorans]AWB26720.1 hypothetical protein HARCEL1_02815 [Halococcoides cellulosivorans]